MRKHHLLIGEGNSAIGALEMLCYGGDRIAPRDVGPSRKYTGARCAPTRPKGTLLDAFSPPLGKNLYALVHRWFLDDMEILPVSHREPTSPSLA